MQLRSARGRSLLTVPAPLRVTGPGLLTLRGTAGNGRTNGTYRGALEFRGGTFGGVNAINALPVDEYVKGVIPLESPASWPIEALKAQAVAARTYALTTSKAGAGFEHYPDTRSQVYGGAGAEQASTNLAADADRRPARHLRRHAGADVLLLDLGRAHGGRREHDARDRAEAVAEVGRGRVRRRLAEAPLGPDPDDATGRPERG